MKNIFKKLTGWIAFAILGAMAGGTVLCLIGIFAGIENLVIAGIFTAITAFAIGGAMANAFMNELQSNAEGGEQT